MEFKAQLVLQADRCGAAEVVEALHCGKGLHDGRRFSQRGTAELDPRGAALDLVDREAGQGFSRASGR